MQHMLADNNAPNDIRRFVPIENGFDYIDREQLIAGSKGGNVKINLLRNQIDIPFEVLYAAQKWKSSRILRTRSCVVPPALL